MDVNETKIFFEWKIAFAINTRSVWWSNASEKKNATASNSPHEHTHNFLSACLRFILFFRWYLTHFVFFFFFFVQASFSIRFSHFICHSIFICLFRTLRLRCSLRHHFWICNSTTYAIWCWYIHSQLYNECSMIHIVQQWLIHRIHSWILYSSLCLCSIHI